MNRNVLKRNLYWWIKNQGNYLKITLNKIFINQWITQILIIDNCEFVPIIDELKEITYINRYFTFFDLRVSNFVTSDLIQPQIEET